eukprot:snap_masked-scaffold_7-processed-gene-16.18-mRNA-1 protein AED:1.00 eAED:1.00 QI:0/0/0/0/1/1/2/0/98
MDIVETGTFAWTLASRCRGANYDFLISPTRNAYLTAKLSINQKGKLQAFEYKLNCTASIKAKLYRSRIVGLQMKQITTWIILALGDISVLQIFSCYQK